MSIETAIDALTIQTTSLLDTCVSLRESTEVRIAEAVTTSVNGTVEPLIQVATNLVGTQTLLVTLIAGGTT